MSNIRAVRDSLKTLVDGVSSIQGSFDYQTGDNTGYPFAVILPSSGESEFGDSIGSGRGRNIQTMRFNIFLYQEREKHLFGQEKSENITIDVLDDVLEALHQDTTLSGSVIMMRPVSWEMDHEIRNEIVRTATITVEATKAVDST